MSEFLLQDELLNRHIPKDHCNSNPSTPTSRLERLLRERELRRFTRSFHSTDESRNNKGDMDVFGTINNLYLSEDDKAFRESDFFEGMDSPKPLNGGSEIPDSRVPKQRLLVVANRLPVSAVRKSEDTWTLEISVGGLVSALLGKNLRRMPICI